MLTTGSHVCLLLCASLQVSRSSTRSQRSSRTQQTRTGDCTCRSDMAWGNSLTALSCVSGLCVRNPCTHVLCRLRAFPPTGHWRQCNVLHCTCYAVLMLSSLLADFTWAHFKWAMSCGMSRQNVVPDQTTGGRDMALIPVFDLVNAATVRSHAVKNRHLNAPAWISCPCMLVRCLRAVEVPCRDFTHWHADSLIPCSHVCGCFAAGSPVFLLLWRC